MSRNIPTVSLLDSLSYNLGQVVPAYLQGLFTRNRSWVSFWTKFHPDPLSVRFGRRLRRKYGSDYLYIRMLTTRSLLVLDPDGIRRVLDRSPDIYADARLKRDGMSHFQPGAVTISRGAEWRDRRQFNEAVLDAGRGAHRYADYFLSIIRSEIDSRREEGPCRSWADFEALFDKISVRIIFGQAARDDAALMGTLKKMMRESNRAFGLRKSRHFDGFYDRIRGYLHSPEEHSLVALCAQAPSTETTRMENQIPHWMFAMNETLSANTARALALIASYPPAQERVRAEMARADLSSAQGVDGLKYLEGCVQEAMRLWPTTPWLIRETVAQDVLGGMPLPPKTQVVILNSFNHRDRERYPDADTFRPELWLDGGGVDYRFNHLSNGPQGCAGKELALFLAKAFLATLLQRDRYLLRKPVLDPGRPLPDRFNYFDVVFAHPPH